MVESAITASLHRCSTAPKHSSPKTSVHNTPSLESRDLEWVYVWRGRSALRPPSSVIITDEAGRAA
ncbi:hypothetical protein E2C01_082837 [Portunus trituberculatus]|uniref:Uncharacterized protein n=1 Tax=Portunus trituberculatus TaxID=210409 RepID=A0A5B7J0C1_PORTR|nr:hypothetical protein [Portunus trituberculatus]